MRDELLAYLLNDLGPDERERIEQRLENDTLWQQELERLRSCMAASPSDPQEVERPPDDLVNRTCSFVHKAVHQRPSAASASLSESCDVVASRSRRWSWADFTIGASVLVVVAMLALPALRESRETARRLKCQDNLRTLGAALVAFADQTGGRLPQIDRDENVGMFVVQLAERGILTREQLAELLVCPSSQLAEDVLQGDMVMRVPSREELRAASPAQLEQLRQTMAGSFAYRIGYVDQQGKYQHLKFVGSRDAPMLADAPSFEVAGFQSANHGGCGQNVLFQDLSVRYCNQCATDADNDHLFLNHEQQHEAGRTPADTVLVRGEYGPFGPLTTSAGR